MQYRVKNETVVLCTATFLILAIFFYIDLHHESLKKQHRMRPEISQLSRHIYPDLEDHETVFRYENISGVKHNIYFVHHDEIEVCYVKAYFIK